MRETGHHFPLNNKNQFKLNTVVIMQQKRLSVSPLSDRHFKGQHYVALGSIPTPQTRK